MKRYVLCAMLLAFILLFLPKEAQACQNTRRSAEILETQDGQFLLVTIQRDFNKYWFDAKEIAIKNTYNQPGLYWAKDPLKPVWVMPFEEKSPQFSLAPVPSELYTSTDGKYLAAVTEFKGREPLMFYREGKLTKSYSYEQIKPPVPGSINCNTHEWIKGIQFDRKEGVLIIQHLSGEELSFSIYTGERLGVLDEIEAAIPIWAGAGFLLWGLFGLYLWRKRSRQKR